MSNESRNVNEELSLRLLAGNAAIEAMELSAPAGFSDEDRQGYDSMQDAPAHIQAEWAEWAADVARNDAAARADAVNAELLAFFGGENPDTDPTPPTTPAPSGGRVLVVPHITAVCCSVMGDDALIELVADESTDADTVATAAAELARRLDAAAGWVEVIEDPELDAA